MNKFKKLLSEKKPVIGMIHLPALPGTPNNRLGSSEIIEKSIEEAIIYKNEGIDSIMIENMHDIPYLNRNVGHEITSLMAIIGYEIKNKTNLPIGIQVLAGGNKQALAVAKSASLDYIRTEGFVFSHIADEGFMNSDAGELMRFRKNINAEEILVFTDIKKKHASHTFTNDISLSETAKAAQFFMSDGVIITGKSTAEEINIQELTSIQKELNIPILAGSGINIDNIPHYFNLCNAFIVGSYFKKEGIWYNDIDIKRLKAFVQKINSISNN